MGGGIVGCGIARDAATRGYKVLLVEMGDFGHGASAGSTHLIHGGLRYLKQLDFALVQQDLREREILLYVAPHLVRPLAFLVPVYEQPPIERLALRTGMALYDVLAWGKSLPPHRRFSAQQTGKLEPNLRPEGLRGSFLYYDAIVSSVERLCLENVLAAEERGARAFNYVRADGLWRQGESLAGLEVSDVLTGDKAYVPVRAVVVATGPWLDNTLAKFGRRGAPLLRRTKGIHLVTPPATTRALVLFASDGRLFFTVPWNGQSLVGTTDTDFQGDPETAFASREDVGYLRDGIRPFLSEGPWNEIHFTTAGVRALVRVEGVAESAVPRGHRLVDHEKGDELPGVISVVGGKITAYRKIAQEVVDLAGRKLGARPPASTDRIALPGARFESRAQCLAATITTGRKLKLDDEQSRYLVDIYGIRAQEVLALVEREPRLGERISPEAPDILAQVAHAVAKEKTVFVEDFMLRRSLLGQRASRGVEAAGAVAKEMGALLGWDQARAEAEKEACLTHIWPTLGPSSAHVQRRAHSTSS